VVAIIFNLVKSDSRIIILYKTFLAGLFVINNIYRAR